MLDYDFEYRDDGQLWSKTPIVNGKKEGLEESYHPSGRPHYATPWVDNKRHGVETYYFDGVDQVVRVTTSYVEGSATGVEKEYALEGYLLRRTHWESDFKIGLEQYFYSNGALRGEIYYTKVDQVTLRIDGRRVVSRLTYLILAGYSDGETK